MTIKQMALMKMAADTIRCLVIAGEGRELRNGSNLFDQWCKMAVNLALVIDEELKLGQSSTGPADPG